MEKQSLAARISSCRASRICPRSVRSISSDTRFIYRFIEREPLADGFIGRSRLLIVPMINLFMSLSLTSKFFR